MPTNLDLAALIRCLEVMADENSWQYNSSLHQWELGERVEINPYEVSEAALALLKASIELSDAIEGYKDWLK